MSLDAAGDKSARKSCERACSAVGRSGRHLRRRSMWRWATRTLRSSKQRQHDPIGAHLRAPRRDTWRMLRAVEGHLGSNQVSRVLNGTIIGLALVVALEDHHPRPGVMVATLLGTAVAVSLAEFYSEIVGPRSAPSIASAARVCARSRRARARWPSESASPPSSSCFPFQGRCRSRPPSRSPSGRAWRSLASTASGPLSRSRRYAQGARPCSRCRAHWRVPGQPQGADALNSAAAGAR